MNLLIKKITSPFYKIVLQLSILNFLFILHTLYFSINKPNLIGIRMIFTIINLLIVNIVILNLYRKLHKDKTWFVWKEIVGFIIVFITAFIVLNTGDIIIIVFFKGIDFKEIDLLRFLETKNILTAFLFALFGLIFLRSSAYLLRLAQNRKSKSAKRNQNTSLRIQDKKTTYTINPDEILYIKAYGNYSEIYFKINTSLNKQKLLVRHTLKELENQNIDNLLRVHKSYILNALYIVSYHSSSKNRFVKLKEKDIPIPISRKYFRILEEKLAIINKTLPKQKTP